LKQVWRRLRRPKSAPIKSEMVNGQDWKDTVGEFSEDGGLTFQTLFSVTNCHEFDRSFSVRRTFAPVVADNFRLRILSSSNTNNPNYA
jgi:hypothetical protein